MLYHEDRFQDVLSELVRAKWTHGQTIVCSHYIKNLQVREIAYAFVLETQTCGALGLKDENFECTELSRM